MKKSLGAVVLSSIMALSLAACGGASTPATTAAAKPAAGSTAAAAGSTAAAGKTAATTAAGKAASSGTGTFKIGVFEPLSGANAAYGTELKNAVEMAVDEINAKGGFNGEQAQVIAYDTQGTVEEAVKVASKLVNEDKVGVIIGSMNSSEMFAAGQTLNEAKVYTLGCGTSPSWMAENWPYVFRPAVNNAMTVPTIAKLIKDTGYTSVAGFYGQDDASLATFKNFKKSCEEQGIEVKDSESYDQGDTDYSAQVTNIVNSGAECVYISVNGETGPVIVKQLRQYGYKGIIFDKESFMAAQVKIAGADNSSYIAFANPYVTYQSIDDIDIDNVKEFAQKYKDKYGNINQTDSAYRGWDAILVLQEACKLAGKNDPDSLKEATNKIKDLKALGGTIDFTPGDREAYHDIRTFVLDNGKNIPWDTWKSNGGYDAFLKATGLSK